MHAARRPRAHPNVRNSHANVHAYLLHLETFLLAFPAAGSRQIALVIVDLHGRRHLPNFEASDRVALPHARFANDRTAPCEGLLDHEARRREIIFARRVQKKTRLHARTYSQSFHNRAYVHLIKIILPFPPSPPLLPYRGKRSRFVRQALCLKIIHGMLLKFHSYSGLCMSTAIEIRAQTWYIQHHGKLKQPCARVRIHLRKSLISLANIEERRGEKQESMPLDCI